MIVGPKKKLAKEQKKLEKKKGKLIFIVLNLFRKI